MLAFLSKPIGERGRLTLNLAGITARLMSYGYDSTTAFSKSVADIEDQATILIDALNLERGSPSEQSRPLVFVAHSLGGVIVKKVFSSSPRPIPRQLS